MKPIQQTKFFIYGFIFFVALSSCTPLGSDGSLVANIKSTSVTAINMSLKSCKALATGDDPDLSAPSFIVPKLELTWKGKKTFTLAFIKITIISSSLSSKFEYYIRDEELQYIFGQTDFEPKTTAYVNSCGFRVGGLPLKNLSQSASGSAQVLFYGITPDDDSNYVDVQGYGSFSFVYSGS